MSRLIRAVPVCLLLLLLPAIARADSVIITGGSLTIGCPTCTGRASLRSIGFNFNGANFSARGTNTDGSVQRVFSNCTFGPCAAGTSISPNSDADLSSVLAGSATFNGVGYDPSFFSGGIFMFRGAALVIPPLDAEFITLTTPFEISGSLSVQSTGATGRVPVFDVTVQGSGIATLTLFRVFGGYQLTEIRYDFSAPAATPEPATLLLLGTGLAGMCARRRRRPRARQ